MAGGVFISDGLSLPVSTRQFDYLVKYIGEAFLPSEQKLRSEVFRPYEKGAMNFIVAGELDKGDFRKFCDVVERALQSARLQERFEIHRPLWEKLQENIRADPRFVN
jgi:hypothetical protein